MATHGAGLSSQVHLFRTLKDPDAGTVCFRPRPDEGVAKGIAWKTVPERPLDEGGPDTRFEALPSEFPGVSAIEHLGSVAERYPHKTCVDDGTRQLTFAQLHAAVLKLAGLLSARVPAGQAVGLMMPNCVWHPAAMLACIAAGRPCIPLNYRDPVGRNTDISTDAGVTFVIGCGPNAPPSFAELAGMHWIDITDLPDQGNGSAPQPLAISVDEPALILYTSGSTGRPKGIVNSQRSLLQRVLQHVNTCHLSADEVFFPLSGPATIAGCREMLTSLLIGAQLFIADLEALGLNGTRRAIGSQRATVIYSVPTLLRALISAGKNDDFQSVRILRIGGEKVLTADIDLFRQAMPRNCYVQISYSSTETTGSQWFPPSQFDKGSVTAPVGHLLPGISFAVVDDNGASVPQGECGELMISSRFVTLGRWEKGALIPARTDPDDQTRRIHATGDLVYFDSQDVMHVVGRKDRQIKINGRRLEPAELEVAVRQIPRVADAVAVITAANELVIFIALEANSGIAFPGVIWEVIRKTLPASLHPRRLHEVANIPRLEGGKVDVVTLLARDSAIASGHPVLPSATHGAGLSSQVHLFRALKDPDVGTVCFRPGPDEGVANGIAWKTVPERPLDEGGPDTRFEALPSEFPGVSAIEHLGSVAERYPHKTCVDDGTRQLTFAQLHAAVLKLAGLLSARVPAGQAVGLMMPNCVWHPAAMLACIAAGRPCIPLNYRDPVGRNTDISTDAGVTFVIGCGPNAPPSFAELAGMHWIDITDLPDQGNGSAPQPLAISVDEPALILYTSGSTGRPKGIVNSQRSLLQRVLQYVNASHLSADEVFFPLSGPATIAGCREMLTSLLIGAKLFIADLEALGIHATRRAIGSQRATVIYSVPTLLRALISAGKNDDFQSVRILRIGGEKVLTADIDLFRQAMPRSCYVQIGYSSTETTGTQCFPPSQFDKGSVTAPVGHMLPGISFAVVDDNGASVPQGECGELMISSRFVTLGRWEKGALIPARADPDDQTRRIHATGDLVYFDSQDVMHVVGRKDRQIKINGRRLEPAELEVAVRQIPRVADAVAVITAANELVIFIALEANSGIAFPSAIWEVIHKTLPASLHPKRLHEVASIPRLEGGKVDVVTLLARDSAIASGPPVSPSPRSTDLLCSAQSAVEQVWRRVLNTRNATGRWDEAGGDSLGLLRFVMELEDLIGRELDLSAFTLGADVTDMAAAVADALNQDTDLSYNQSSNPPLFLVPGSIGYGPSLSAFGVALGGIAEVTTIRYPDLNGVLAGQSAVTDMAASAMEQIQRIQPTGDVRLLSYSLGGGVAFEIASRLIAEGRKIRFFGVLDTNVGGGRSGYGETISRTLGRIRTHRVTVYRMMCRSISKIFVRMGREQLLARVLELKYWKYIPGTRFMLKLEAEEVLRMRAFRNWVRQAHRQLPIVGTVFSCGRARVSPRLGWDRLVERLEVIPIDGGHLDLFVEPHLSINQPLIARALVASYRKPAAGEAHA